MRAFKPSWFGQPSNEYGDDEIQRCENIRVYAERAKSKLPLFADPPKTPQTLTGDSTWRKQASD